MIKKSFFIFLILFACLYFINSDDTAIKVDSNGNVGINTQTPAKQLDVNGDTKISGDIEINGAVTIEEDTEISGSAEITGNLTVSGVTYAHVPKGVIVMWSGDPDDLPAGWSLCNGSNGTPNLSGRFVVGYNPNDTDYNTKGKKGGAKTVTLTVAQLPSHHHDMSHTHSGYTGTNTGMQDWGAARGTPPTHATFVKDENSNFTDHAGENGNIFKFNDTSHTDHKHYVNTSSSGWSLTTPVSGNNTGNTGSNQAHENRPPYYVLAYIMKL